MVATCVKVAIHFEYMYKIKIHYIITYTVIYQLVTQYTMYYVQNNYIIKINNDIFTD